MEIGTRAIIEKLEALLGPKVGTGHEVLTVSSSVASLTPTANSSRCFITVESSVTSGIVIREWQDGTAPDANNGIAWSHLDRFEIIGLENMNKFKAIQTQVGTHKLHIQYYK